LFRAYLREEGLLSLISRALREGIDFFANTDEDLLLFPAEIRIDEAMQVGGETRKETKSHQSADG
jgi:hypothetical protein